MALTDNRESRPWGPTRLTLLAYGFATIIGFIHAQAYYGSFNLNILNYIHPIDLLFISLEHIDKVVVVTFVIVPIVLIWVAVGLPILFLAILALFALIASVLSIYLIAFSAAVPIGVGAVINPSRALVLRFKWLRMAFVAMRIDRRNRVKEINARRRAKDKDVNSIEDPVATPPQPFSLTAAYKSARKDSNIPPPMKMGDYIKKAKTVISTVPNVIKWVVKTWRRVRDERFLRWSAQHFEKGSWRPKSPKALARAVKPFVYCLVGIFLVHVGWAAWRIGKVDAMYAVQVPQTAIVVNEFAQDNWQTAALVYAARTWQATLHWFVDDYIGQAICPAMPMVTCGSLDVPEKIYIVPTGNVSSMHSCVDEEGRNENEVYAEGTDDEMTFGKDVKSSIRMVSVGIRHGTREHSRSCLAYLGGTGSMQFFADLSGGTKKASDGSREQDVGVQGDVDPVGRQPARPVVVVFSVPGIDVKQETGAASTDQPATKDDSGGGRADGGDKGRSEDEDAGGGVADIETVADTRTVVVVVDNPTGPKRILEGWSGACDMKMAAWVGPFAEGAHDLGESQAAFDECFAEDVEHLEVGQSSDENGDAVGDWWRQQRPEAVQRLIIVGRADKEPISNELHFSNFALAQSRADWVKDRLAETKLQSEKLHVLSIPGGPATPEKVDPCDRVVEIHMCSRSAGVVESDTDAGAEHEDQPGAGGGVGEAL